MKRTFLGLSVSLAAMVACVNVNKSVLTDMYAANPVPWDEVQIFFAPDDSIPEHVRVAVLYAEGDLKTTTKGGMINALRKEAGKLGANAIILGAVEDPSSEAQIIAALLDAEVERTARAIAIYCPSLDTRSKKNP